MAEHSKIEWTDATWNPITGCSVVSPGCTNCYAMRLAGTRLKHHPSRAGLTRKVNGNHVWTGETRVNWEWMEQPLTWTRPRMIFVCAHGDLMHESVHDDDIATVYGTMVAAHHLRGHILQVLTKRSGRMRKLLNSARFWHCVNSHANTEIMARTDPAARLSTDARATCGDYGPDNPPPGIWLGVSAEDQHRADERIPDLLATPAAIRWLSAEPLLAGLDLTRINLGDGKFLDALRCVETWADGTYSDEGLLHIDWVVAGGESGHGARTMHPDWVRSLRDQCAAAGVPFFFKQWGEHLPVGQSLPGCGKVCGATAVQPGRLKLHFISTPKQPPEYAFAERGVEFASTDDGRLTFRVGKTRAGRLLDGVEHNGFPEVRP